VAAQEDRGTSVLLSGTGWHSRTNRSEYLRLKAPEELVLLTYPEVSLSGGSEGSRNAEGVCQCCEIVAVSCFRVLLCAQRPEARRWSGRSPIHRAPFLRQGECSQHATSFVSNSETGRRNYYVPYLAPGSYRLTIEAGGFKRMSRGHRPADQRTRE